MAANVKVTQRIVGARSRADTAVGSRPKLNTVSTRAVDRKSTRLNSSHSQISYAVFCLKKKKEFLARAARVGRLGIRLNFEAGETAGACHQKQATDNAANLNELGMQFLVSL